MFFLASKVFWLLAQPLSVVFLVMLGAVVALLWGKKRLALVALFLGVLVHGAVSFTNLGYLVMQPLEDRFAVPSPPPQIV